MKLIKEIIIIDDGSDTDTQNFLRALRGKIRLFTNDNSIGFGPANNLGAKHSKSDWLLFMNNDLVLTENWDKPFGRIIKEEEKLDQLGCLGNVQLDPRTKAIDHAGITFSKGHPSHFLQGEDRLPDGEFSEYLAVTGACFLVRRDLFLDVGGFDHKYKTGFEDIDLCFRLRMLGYKHYVSNQSRIWHKRSSTPQRNLYQTHNSKVFYGRWGKIMTRFEEWERVTTNQSKKKNGSYNYVTKEPEKFLFADKTLLLEHFNLFIRSQKFAFARKILVLFKRNFQEDDKLRLLESRLLRKEGKPEAANQIIEGLKTGTQSDSFILERAQVAKSLRNFNKARRYFTRLANKGFLPGYCQSQLGESYLEEEKFAKAEEALIKSLAFEPDSSSNWLQLAGIYQKNGKKKEEIHARGKAFSCDNRNQSLFNDLFKAYFENGLLGMAYALVERNGQVTLPIASCMDFARACLEVGDLETSLKVLNKLLKKRYDEEQAFFLKGNVMVLLKQFERAIKCYADALNLRPDWPEASSNLFNSKTFLCDWKSRDHDLRNLQEFHRNKKILGGAFELAGIHWNEEEEKSFALDRSKKIFSEVEYLRKNLRLEYLTKKKSIKRIGFLSSDFRNHAVGHVMARLIESLDHKKYEVFLYATSPDEESEVRNRIESAGNFRYIFNLSLSKQAIAIHKDSLDLLIDLGGFSRGHNAQLLALRPAPIQAHFLGYASTMGKGLVDYMIADATVIPSSSSKFYGEKVVRMNGCFFPPGDFDGFAKRAKRKEVGLPARGIVFCAFHAAYKIEPEIWGCWMRILKGVPESILWLKFKPADEAMKNLKADAVRLGVSSKRIILAEDLPDREAHLSRMAVADLYLDCPLYNGHASAMDALHAKLPILTVKGIRFCNRVGESFCKNLDLQEMICKDLKKYEEKAIELALRPSKLLPLRKKIQKNTDAVLSPIEHTKRFEEALDIILAKPKKVAQQSAYSRPKKSIVSTKAYTSSLGDFSLVMIRPPGVSNWAYNISMLADELKKYGGSTIVLDQTNQKAKKTEFSKSVRVINPGTTSFAEAVNHAFSELKSKYLFYLDDPLRVLPASHFIETVKLAKEALGKNKTGVLGICSSMEPHTGCLVTKLSSSNKQNPQVAGFFSPSFVVNLDAVRLTGGLRDFGDSMALSVLDLSLRLEKEGYRSWLIETEKIICPAHSGREYLSQSSKSDLHRFVKLWNRKPSSLKPKHPPRDEQVGETADYQEWIRLCDTITEGNILAFRKEADDLNHKPLISVIMPVFDPPKKFLIKAIESVISQAYENWELCIADDASTKKYIRPLLESYASKDSRIKVTFRKTNGHISVASNSAVKLATGQFVAFLDHDDELRPHSLLEVAKVINQHPDAKLIYSDEDKIDELGGRYEPYFKPDWNPDLLLGQNYISHLSVFEASLLRKLKGLRKGYEGSQDWDLTLRFTEQIKKTCILHAPKILYHWRAIKGSAALSKKEKNYAAESGIKAVKDCVRRRQIKGKVEPILETWCRVQRSLPEYLPKVSIIIPIRDKIDLLKNCISSIRRTVSYPNLEIIILNNDSEEQATREYLREINRFKNIQVLNIRGKFNFSRLNNIGSQKASGELLLLLNNDTVAIHQNWLEQMIVHAIRDDVGCVGAKLLNQDKTIQHGGVVFGHYGGGIHAFRNLPMQDARYNGHLQLERNYSAVTAACLMVKKKDFLNVGGLDETNFAVSYNDTDFCLRIQNSGLYNLFTPHANLYHLESVSRGSDLLPENIKRATKERNSQHQIWCSKIQCDPQYNVNLSRHFEDFSHFRFVKNLPNQKRRAASKKNDLKTNRTSGEKKKKLAEQRFGVNIFGFFRQDFGLARAGKCLALGLKEAGVTLNAFQLPYNGGHESVDPLYCCNSKPPKDLRKLNIFCCNGDYTKQFVPNWLEEKKLRQGYNVGYWHWEMPYFPDVFESHFNLLDEIWVPSNFTAKSIGKKSLLPLQVIPYPIDVPEKLPHLEYIPFRFPSGSFVLLTAFDFMSSVERKNPVAVIKAFSECIRRVPNLHLAIKTVNHDGFPKGRDELRMALSEIPTERYTIIDNTLSRNELLSLFSQTNAFISLHRAEGFGMMMAEAMTLGLPVIATAWSANMEFMTNSNSYPVKYSLRPNKINDGPYPAGIPWAEVEVKHAIEQIMRCVSNVQERQIIAARGKATVKMLFSKKRLCAKIGDRISLIEKKLEKNNRVRLPLVSKVKESKELGEERVNEVIDRLRVSIRQRK